MFPLMAKPSPPFLHMPLDFKDLGRVGIGPELVALTGVDTAPGSTEAVVEVGSRGIDGSPITTIFAKGSII